MMRKFLRPAVMAFPLKPSLPAPSRACNSFLRDRRDQDEKPDYINFCTLLSRPRCDPSMGWPIRQRRQPIPPSSCPPCLRRRQCRYRSGSGTQPRSLWVGPSVPSSHPPRIASARPASSSRDMGVEAIAVQEARWQDSAESWCVGTRNHGSSGYRAGTGVHQRRVSGWARHPTETRLV